MLYFEICKINFNHEIYFNKKKIKNYLKIQTNNVIESIKKCIEPNIKTQLNF